MSKCFVKQDVLLNSISRSFMILLISLQKCIKTGKITIHLSSPDRDETFDSLKSAATGRSLNPSARTIRAGWKRIVRHTDNRITRVSPMLLRENPVSSSFSIHLSPIFEGTKRRASRIAAHPSRGRIATTRDDTYTSRSHTQVIVSAVQPRLPPPCSNRSAGVLLRGASRGCSRLQVHLALPPIRAERRREFRRRALWSSDIIKAERSPWETGETEPPDAPSAHRTAAGKRRRGESAG